MLVVCDKLQLQSSSPARVRNPGKVYGLSCRSGELQYDGVPHSLAPGRLDALGCHVHMVVCALYQIDRCNRVAL